MQATRQIITIPLQNEAQTYTPQFALFSMENGRAIMMPCDADGNLLSAIDSREESHE